MAHLFIHFVHKYTLLNLKFHKFPCKMHTKRLAKEQNFGLGTINANTSNLLRFILMYSKRFDQTEHTVHYEQETSSKATVKFILCGVL